MEDKKTITKEFIFHSAHKLENKELSEQMNKDIFGKCYNVHGHTYKLLVTVSGVEFNGMIVNFVKLKKIVNYSIIEEVDHLYLNDVAMFTGIITTCEEMIEIFFDKLSDDLAVYDLKLEKLVLYETPTAFATYEGF